MTFIVKSVTSNQYEIKVVNQNGSLLQAPASVPTVAASAISDLGQYSNTSAMLANDATTYANAVTHANNAASNAYANAVSYVDGKSFVNTSQLSSNLANYQTTAGLAANVAGLTSNNSSNLGGLPAASYVNTSQLSSNLTNYQTTAGLSANVARLTANNSTNFGGLSLATVQGQITSNAATAYSNAVTYVDGKSFVNTSTLAIDLAGYQTTAGLAFAVSNLQANSAVYLDGVTITTIDNRITSNASAAYTNAVSYVDGKSFVNTAQLSGNLSNYQTTAGLAANVATLTSNNSNNLGGLPAASYVNTSQLSSNLSNYQTAAGLSANVATLTSNNSNNLGGLPAASYVNTSQLSSNLSNYQTTAGLSANVATLTANNSTNLGGLPAASYVNTSQLSSNLANYQTTAGLAANVATLTSNNATNAFGKTENNLNVNNALTANNSNNLGGLPAASYVNTSQLSSNLSNYQTTAGLAANVATLTANNSTNLGGLPAASYVNTSQLSSNLSNYQTTAGLAANVATLTSNNSTNLGGLPAASYVNTSQLSANLSNYQTTAGLSANVATLTANDSTNLGGLPAASYVNTSQLSSNLFNYQTTTGLAANVATLTANNSTNLGGLPASSYVNTSQLSSNLANYAALSGATFTGQVNTTTLNTSGNTNVGGTLTVSGNLVVNGSYTVVTGNSVVYTDNMLFLNQGISANITNIVGNGSVVTFTGNNNYQVGWDVVVTGVNPSSYNGTYLNITFANSTIFRVANTNTASYVSGGVARGQTESNPDLGFAAGYNDGTYKHTGFFRDHSSGVWKVFDGYLPEPDASVYIDQTNNSFNIARFQASELRVGNNATYGVVNTTNFTGTANNATNLGGIAAASYVNTSQLSSNLSNYQTTAGLAANVATLTANNTTNFNGQPASFYTNATNLTTGTLPNSRLSTSVVNTSGNFTVAGNINFTAANNRFVEIQVGANVDINTTAVFVGNASVNSTITAGQLFLSGVTVNSTIYQGTANNANNLGGQPSSFYTNAENIASGTLPNARLSGDVVNTSANFTVAGMLTFANGITISNTITANGSNGSAGQVLTSAGATGNVYWAAASGGFTNGQSISVNNFTLTGAFTANSSNGSAGQILISNGAGAYWGPAPTGGGGTVTQVNTGIGLSGGPVTTSGTISVLANSGIVANSTGVFVNTAYIATLDANNSTNFGGLSLATVQGQITGNAATAYSNAVSYVDGRSFVNTSQLSSNLSNYQTTAGLAANVATLTANNSTNLGGLSAASYVNTSQLSSNLSNYQTTAGLASNVATLTSNNSTNFGGLSLATVQSQISGNAGTAYTNAVNYVTAQSFVNTSQLSSNLSLYQTLTGLAANVLTLTANNTTNFNSQPASFYTNATNLSTGTLDNARLPATINVTTVNAATLSVGTAVTANSSGTIVNVNSSSAALRITQTGTGNALVVEDSANPDATPLTVDSTGRLLVGATAPQFNGRFELFNNTSAAINMCIIAETNLALNPTFLFYRRRADFTPVSSGTGLGAFEFWGDDGNVGAIGARISAVVDGTVSADEMPTRLTFSTNAPGDLDGEPIERMRITSAGNVGIATTTPDARLAVTGTANISGNVVIGGTLNAANVTATLFTGNVTGTASNATNLNSQPGSFYTNATNITTGTLDNARLPATINITTVNAAVHSVGTIVVANTQGVTTSANITIGSTGELVISPGAGIFANGSLGTAGQALFSNGSSIYWDTVAAGVNVAAQFSWTNTHSFAANLTIGSTSELIIANGAGIQANGTFGTAGQVLSSNGVGVYWADSGISAGGTATLTNKRIDPRVFSTASATSVTPDISTTDMYVYTALSTAITVNASTGGSPVDGNKMTFRFKDNGTARGITWTTSGSNSFRAVGVTLPTTTVINKVTYVGCIYNAAESFWDVVAVLTQA